MIESSYRPLVMLVVVIISTAGCHKVEDQKMPTLAWYVFSEPSGAFLEAAEDCTQQAAGSYRIVIRPLPADADQQREQLSRRLAAGDADIDIIGMDVIWTAEFAEARWILSWSGSDIPTLVKGRLPAATASATYRNRLWAVPFTSNAQLLWYRRDRIGNPPPTWHALIEQAESIGVPGSFQIQGQRYEGLTVFFVSLLASAGGSVLDANGDAVSLDGTPTVAVLKLMKRLADSPAADPALDTAREDESRLAFETGVPTFMVNYSFVWPSALHNAPDIAAEMAFARWPSVHEGMPSRVAIGGLNLAVGAFSRHPEHAFEAAECLASEASQRKAAIMGGLPPTLEALYDAPDIRRRFPFADMLRDALHHAVLRPKTPVYNDISLAISRTLHPLRDLDPDEDAARLRRAVTKALHSEGLL